MISSSIKNKLKIGLRALGLLTVSLVLSGIPDYVSAYNSFYADNNIMFYDENSAGSCSSGGVILTRNRDDLPQEAVSIAETANIESLFDENKERYQYASDEYKKNNIDLPTQALAALHYREASMNPEKSMADGSSLDSGVSADGLVIYEDPNEDTLDKTDHFFSMASSVYGLDKQQIGSWTMDDWGHAFLAYNRGSMYKVVNESYKNSPYVMNYIDDSRIGMKWIRADSYYNENKLNDVEGSVNTQLGALTVMLYLGYDFTGTSSSQSNCLDNLTGSNEDIVRTAINLSWDDKSHSQDDPKPEYRSAQESVGLLGSGCGMNGASGGAPIVGQDCGVFVATVMRHSKADEEFPIGTSIIINYLRNNTDKYENIENKKNTSNLMPGDIFIVNGHIMMYVGTQANGYDNASASCGHRTADHGGKIYFSDDRGDYEIYRKI